MEGAGSNRPVEEVVRGDDPNRDLYCLECGYNLRGLSGDPRRCPECGHDNPMSELTIPAGAITRTLRQMETAPTLCVAAAGVLLLIGCLLCWILIPTQELGAAIFLLAYFLLVPVFWMASAAGFKDACGGHPGWVSALVKYHVYGLGAATMGGALIIATGVVLCGGFAVKPPWGIILAIDGGAIVAMLFFGRWARRDIKSAIDPIQRHMAVRIAREEIAKRMRRSR